MPAALGLRLEPPAAFSVYLRGDAPDPKFVPCRRRTASAKRPIVSPGLPVPTPILVLNRPSGLLERLMSPFVRTRLLPAAGFVAGFVVLATALTLVLLARGGGNAGSGVGGSFALTSQDAATVTQTALAGHPTLVFFGYTHCPDVCPATLSEISSVFKALGSDPAAQREARALFITVDPQRDTPVVMKDYLSSFDPRITGLTGTPGEIKGVESVYKAYAKAVPDADGTYTMDHTAITYLMDKDGNFVGAFNLDRPAPQAAAELRQYF